MRGKDRNTNSDININIKHWAMKCWSHPSNEVRDKLNKHEKEEEEDAVVEDDDYDERTKSKLTV